MGPILECSAAGQRITADFAVHSTVAWLIFMARKVPCGKQHPRLPWISDRMIHEDECMPVLLGSNEVMLGHNSLTPGMSPALIVP
jgi:hypothetical protein